MKLVPIMLLIGILFVSGCVTQNQSTGSGISIKATLEPSKMVSSSQSTLYVQIENVDISSVDAQAEVFNTGILQQLDECKDIYPDFLPKEIRTLQCRLQAPSHQTLTKDTTPTAVDYKVVFKKLFSAPVTFQVIGSEEFTNRQLAGNLKYQPQIYTFSDPNVIINVDFNKAPPFITREGEKIIMHIKIRASGPGFLQDISTENFIIEDNEGILNCDFPNQVQELTAIKGEFPPITCELNLEDSKNYLRDFIIIIKYNYEYEVRNRVPVTVVK